VTEEQLHWQPESHPNHMMFAMWHAYRSEDDIIHGLLMQKPGVFSREGWAERLPVAEPGKPPFGTGLNREQIAAVRLRLDDLLGYAEAVRASIQDYADGLSEEQGAEQVPLPFFAPVYPMLGKMSRAEVLSFFCIGHTAEHLGEVQYIKGLLGLTGAPL
jgi:DinB family protein